VQAGAACCKPSRIRLLVRRTAPTIEERVAFESLKTLKHIVLRVHTFGRLHVRGTDGGVLSGSAAQPRRLAILALLASAGEQGLTRDKVLAYLWPDAEEERSRRMLNQALYSLRQDLGSDDVFLGTRELRFNPDLVSSDVAEFEEAVSRGKLEDAAARYTGPFLDGFRLPGAPEFDRWAEEERAGLAGSYSESLAKLARRAEDVGDWAQAVEWWRKAAAQDPLNGRVALRLMRALLAANDRNGALRHARVYEALVAQELDLPPDREVVAYAEQLRHEPSAQISEPLVGAIPAAFTAPESEPKQVPVDAASGDAAPAPAAVPPSLAKALSMLEGQHAREPRSTADWVAVLHGHGPRAEATRPASGGRWVLLAVVALLIAGIIILVLRPRPRDVAFGATHPVAVEGALELDPAISPDGKAVAYATDRAGQMRIVLRQLAGGPALSLSDSLPGYHRAPRWSPDGSRIAFQSGGTIYSVSALGGMPRPLVRPSVPSGWVAYPAWSPDGGQIAYVENSVVFSRPVDGGPPRRLASIGAPHGLAWSPDGKWIAFVSGNAAFTFGAQPWGSPTNLGNIAPSSIWLVPANGGAPIRLTDDASLNASPAWLPGSRALVFVSSRLGGREVFRLAVDRNGRPGANPVRLSTGLNAQTVSVSADGKLGAYSVFTYSANVWALDLPPKPPATVAAARPVTNGSQAVEGLAISSDGKWLAFDSDRNGTQQIYRQPLSGGEPEQLTRSSDPDFLSSWSPDGKEIAFYSYRRGTRRVYVIPADGGQAREVAPTLANQRNPVWAPDGQGLVFSASEDEQPSQLYVVRRRSDSTWEAPHRVTTDGGALPQWSPDGRRIAFINEHAVWLVGSGGGRPSLLIPAADSVRYGVPNMLQWEPDGQRIFYKAFDANGQASIWSVASDGSGPATLLIRFDDPTRTSSRPEFATDGKRIYFTLGQRQSDVWTVDLVGAR
jgi:Tol biopolymer transport system component/DNA-binding SARP family transcriptional activator